MRQIIYFSTAADEQDAHSVGRIASASFTHNARDRITGILVAGGHRYLQVIEGEPEVAQATMDRIRRDRRHVGVTVLLDRDVDKPIFSDWSMIFRGQPEFGDFATLGDLVGQLKSKITNREIRDQIACFVRLFVLSPPAPPASPWTLASGYRDKSFLGRGH